MKKPLALLAAFLLMFVVSVTFGIAQANPQTAPETTTTPSTTPTATETPTLTATVPNPCDTAPAAPLLKKPHSGAVSNRTNVKLRWEPVTCASKYRILVRRGSNKGTPVTRGSTKNRHITTSTLSRGYTYYWNIKACTPGQGCTRSETWTFKIPAPPTAVPPPTGQATSTPPPSGSGTPVPGVPPGNLVNYYTEDRGGPSVYLNNSNDYLYRYDCGKDQGLWGHYAIGSTIYNIALWYYPNEKITYQRFDFNQATVVETKTLTVNGSGYLSYNVDTSAWTQNHHYHLLFKGQSSGVEYCGHFDIQSVNADITELQAIPHTPQDVINAYRKGGLLPPE